MPRDKRYDVLFEPLRIGPVTAPNRFYQVPHCSGMPLVVPQSYARMREIKAEGGWGVVTTEACSIHATSDAGPTPEDKLWDDDDIADLAAVAEGIHRHGALAAVETLHHGAAVANRFSREIPISPSGGPLIRHRDPVQSRTMDKSDIREFRRWHLDAVKRAKKAGFDIIYVYAGHEVSLPLQFLWRRFNKRTDEYGGSLENRTRLLRELLEETRAAVGDKCAVALRFAVEEFLGPAGITSEGEGREIVEMLAELPDLWDVTVAGWANDSATSRYAEEGWQEPHVAFVKSVTRKPVVGTGRFTSPDVMASQIRRGVLDLIGTARPSIADPFLPAKIRDGRLDDIRECIGCNVCVTGNNTAVPIRCTQNPTMGEEWRRGWHPERVPKRTGAGAVLVVGAGPAGLECARVLGERGYRVSLAEATRELGGRVAREARLPGLASWARVRDWRVGQINKLANVEVFLESRLTADDVLAMDIEHVVIATGSEWRKDGVGRETLAPVPGIAEAYVLTPDDIMNGAAAKGPVLIYDDDHYYVACSIGEKLRRAGHAVTLATPAAEAAVWTHNTLEQKRIQAQLIELGVDILSHRILASVTSRGARLACWFTGREIERPFATLIPVSGRDPADALYHELISRRDKLKTLVRIGDCRAPGTIAAAVYSGYLHAHDFDNPRRDDVGFWRERVKAREQD
jgi:dimethylamine/trimethylamine dehydrogenase